MKIYRPKEYAVNGCSCPACRCVARADTNEISLKVWSVVVYRQVNLSVDLV